MSAVRYPDLAGPLPDLLAGPISDTVRRVRTPTGDEMWLVCDYALSRRVLADPSFSRAAAARPGAPRLNTASPAPNSIMSMDGREHTRLRRICAATFTTRKVAALTPFIRDITDGLLTEMAERGAPADLVSSYAAPLPVAVLGALLGIPATDRSVFDSSVEVLFDITASSPEQKARQQLLLVDYMSTLIERKRRSGDADLLTELSRLHDAGVLSRGELISLGLALLTAGYETTVGQIALATLALLYNVLSPDTLQDESRVDAVVEELLRITPATPLSFPRVAVEEVQLGSVSIAPGEAVLVSLLHGNWDAKVFPQPDHAQVARPAPHLTFGHGVHRCLGAPLAQLQLRIALTQLFARFPGLHLLAAKDIAWKNGLVTRGLTRLMVAW